ncbi:MAG: RnfABCDGE type electron transport complex subunit D [Bacteroidaceae bacterium]|nr:RnfABCDGE type electron transport complex subunit D [Bacteroidaceae bacterium]
MENKLILSTSPHLHNGDTVERNMYNVILALIPALIASFLFFGVGSLVVTLASVVSCVFFEWSITKYLLKRDRSTISDGSAVLTGLLLAFNLPSNLPLYIIVIGSLVAIGVGKMTFGGLGNNPFNPALVGRVFLLVSFPAKMTTWPVTGQLTAYADAVTGATPLALIKQGAIDQLPPLGQMFLGNTGGCIGEVSVLALLIGFAWLLHKKVITWHIPVSIMVTVFVLAGVMWLINPETYANPLYHLCSGGVMLGAIFMATDYVTSPMTGKGQIIYGICIGLLVMVIRLFGSYPEGMSFAILIMNSVVPLLDNWCKPKRFGEVGK